MESARESPLSTHATDFQTIAKAIEERVQGKLSGHSVITLSGGKTIKFDDAVNQMVQSFHKMNEDERMNKNNLALLKARINDVRTSEKLFNISNTICAKFHLATTVPLLEKSSHYYEKSEKMREARKSGEPGEIIDNKKLLEKNFPEQKTEKSDLLRNIPPPPNELPPPLPSVNTMPLKDLPPIPKNPPPPLPGKPSSNAPLPLMNSDAQTKAQEIEPKKPPKPLPKPPEAARFIDQWKSELADSDNVMGLILTQDRIFEKMHDNKFTEREKADFNDVFEQFRDKIDSLIAKQSVPERPKEAAPQRVPERPKEAEPQGVPERPKEAAPQEKPQVHYTNLLNKVANSPREKLNELEAGKKELKKEIATMREQGLSTENMETRFREKQDVLTQFDKKITEMEGQIKRQNIMNEIKQTEKSFSKQIEVGAKMLSLIKDRKGHKQEVSNFLGKMQGHYQAVGELSKKLTEKFEKATTSEEIADIYASEAFKLFGMHTQVIITNYTQLLNIVTSYLNKNPEFRDKEINPQIKEEAKLDNISSVMIPAIQRLPRHQMLLTDLLKNTPENTPAHPKLQKALVSCTGPAESANTAIKNMEIAKKLENDAPKFKKLISSIKGLKNRNVLHVDKEGNFKLGDRSSLLVRTSDQDRKQDRIKGAKAALEELAFLQRNKDHTFAKPIIGDINVQEMVNILKRENENINIKGENINFWNEIIKDPPENLKWAIENKQLSL